MNDSSRVLCKRVLLLSAAAAFLALAAAQPSRRGGEAVVGAPERQPQRVPRVVPAGAPGLVATVGIQALQIGAPAAATPPPPPVLDDGPLFPDRDDECTLPYRSLDGTCTSELGRELGATERAQFAYLGFATSAETPTGGIPSSLPSARLISNVVFAQSADVFSARNLNEMVTFMGQFLDHSIIATPVVKGANFDIPIPPTDPVFSNFTGGSLHFERSVRALDNRRRERPINELSSAIDLTSVYGPDPARLLALRTQEDGLLKTSPGDLLPLNSGGLPNAPSSSDKFFVAGDRRVNENPMLTSLHTLFMREHNNIARQLKVAFPFWDDETLFQNAKVVNTAQYQKIIFEEYYPAMTGRNLARYTGYQMVDPTVSDVFGAAAFRVGHTMVGNGLPRRGPGNSPLPKLSFQEMFFRENGVLATGIEPFLRGALCEPAQEVDTKVVNALRNFLFTNVQNEIGFDLMALNIQRGRDHALPTYNELREIYGARPATTYRDITANRAVQTALASAYDSIDDIDAIVGMFAEDHVSGASMGLTMLRVWRREFARLRDGDRFAYLRQEAYPPQLWEDFPRLQEMLSESETFKKLILRNTDITASELSGSVWRAKPRS